MGYIIGIFIFLVVLGLAIEIFKKTRKWIIAIIFIVFCIIFDLQVILYWIAAIFAAIFIFAIIITTLDDRKKRAAVTAILQTRDSQKIYNYYAQNNIEIKDLLLEELFESDMPEKEKLVSMLFNHDLRKFIAPKINRDKKEYIISRQDLESTLGPLWHKHIGVIFPFFKRNLPSHLHIEEISFSQISGRSQENQKVNLIKISEQNSKSNTSVINLDD